MSSSISFVRKSQIVSTEAVFESLLERQINIAPGIRSTASDSQNHLRDFLASEHRRDSSFPRVLSIADSDFLGGSFARHTKTWPLDDIDLYVPLDGCSLVYQSYGARLPYTVHSDGVLTWNPLLTPRWMNGMYISSTKLIAEFATVLQRHYGDDTTVYADGQAVSIRLTYGETNDHDGLGYDVVPCFSLKPDDPNEREFYLMPDGNGGWMHTNPRFDTLLSDFLQDYHSKRYRKVVKLVKFWNTNALQSAFGSYYLELAIAREFLARWHSGLPVTSIAEGLSVAFGAVSSAYQQGNQTSWIKGAPPVQRPSLTLLQQITLSFAAENAATAYSLEQTGNPADALAHWRLVFGDKL